MAGLPALIDRVSARITAARRRAPRTDHIIRTQEHYSRVQGSNNAGGISYYGFLSFFPLVALALFLMGKVAEFIPEAREPLERAITSAFPGVLGGGEHALSLAQLQGLANTLGWLGLLGALVTGLGWMSSMRTALLAVFEVEPEKRPDPILGKLRDLMTLPVLALILVFSVVVSSVVGRFAGPILEWLNLSEGLTTLVRVSSLVIGLGASTLLFLSLFVLLGRPAIALRTLLGGAVLAAVGFELLKLVAAYLLVRTEGTPAFQLFGIALILIIWINYFARLALYGAAWAFTAAHPPHHDEEGDSPESAQDEPDEDPQEDQAGSQLPRPRGG